MAKGTNPGIRIPGIDEASLGVRSAIQQIVTKLGMLAKPVFAGVKIGDEAVAPVNIGQWNTAYGWGNHAGLYDALGAAAAATGGHETAYNHGLLHAAATVAGAPLTLSGQQIAFNYDTGDFQLSENSLQVKDGGIDHDSTAGVHQAVGTGASPTFAGLTLTGLSGIVKATAGVLGGSAQHNDLGGVTADQHHAQAHALTGADHTVSGLTPGHVLQALTEATFGFASPAAETDPIFGASPAAGIEAVNIAAWNIAYGWGNHAGLYDALGAAVAAIGGHEVAYDHSSLHVPVTVAAAPLTLSGQQITFNYDAGDFQLNGTSLQIKDSGVDHNALTNYVADRHVAHSGVSISAGDGMSGGGDITVSCTLTNADKGTTARTAHESAYNHANLHVAATVQDTSTVDLTLTGQQISAVILPGGIAHNDLASKQGGTNGQYNHLTDAQVAALHTAATVAAAPLTISGQQITFNYDSGDFQLSGNNLQVKDGGIAHDATAGVHQAVGTGDSPTFANMAVSQVDAGTFLLIENTSSTGAKYPGFGIYNYAGSTTGHPYCGQYKAEGSKAVPTIVTANRTLGTFVWGGHDGTAFRETMRLAAVTEANWSVTQRDTRLVFYTATGVGGVSEKMRLAADGSLWINKTSGTEKLEVGGKIRADTGFSHNGTDGATANVDVAKVGGGTRTLKFSGGIYTGYTDS